MTKRWRQLGIGLVWALLGCKDPIEAGGSTGTSSDTDAVSTTNTTTVASADPTSADTSVTASADSESGTESGPMSCADLQQGITAANLEAHLMALDAIATRSGGNRAAGTAGYDLSVDYVREQLESFGYATDVHEFEFYYYQITGPMALSWQGQQAYVEYTDFQAPQHTDGGQVTATAYAIDVELGLGNTSTSGCEAEDYADFPAGSIALLQRGTCLPIDKIYAAQDAGAVAVVMFNQGDVDGSTGVWWTSLGAMSDIQVPVLLTSYAVGAELAQEPAGSVVLELDVDVIHELRPTATVLAESTAASEDGVVVIGGHLDSVLGGPGINDNGSGVAAMLEVARALHDCETTRRVRFAWWTAEEVGLVGSTEYVASLDDAQRGEIWGYLNLDMVGSPNWARFHLDGDGSSFAPGPPGSDEIEAALVDFFDGIGSSSTELEIGTRSDYRAFVDAGIAAGGVFTGAEGVKTDAEAEAHGGRAGAAYDGCYHQACDDVDNVDLDALETSARAVAYALEVYALP